MPRLRIDIRLCDPSRDRLLPRRLQQRRERIVTGGWTHDASDETAYGFQPMRVRERGSSVLVHRNCHHDYAHRHLLDARALAQPGPHRIHPGPAGLGVILLPRALIGSVWRQGGVALHALPPPDALVETVFVRRRDAYVSSALAAFLAAVPGLPLADGVRIAAE